MSVNTNAIIRKGVTISEICDAISSYGEVNVHSVADDFFRINFVDGADKRMINVFINDYALTDYGIDGVLLSIGAWGNSVAIMRYLCETFGGYLDENDCDDEEFYPINLDLFLTKTEPALSDFERKVIQIVGYNKLKAVMALCNEYKDLNH